MAALKLRTLGCYYKQRRESHIRCPLPPVKAFALPESQGVGQRRSLTPYDMKIVTAHDAVLTIWYTIPMSIRLLSCPVTPERGCEVLTGQEQDVKINALYYQYTRPQTAL